MVIRLKITLTEEEYKALLNCALAELRNPSDQARYFLRLELYKRGWFFFETSQPLDPASKSVLHFSPAAAP